MNNDNDLKFTLQDPVSCLTTPLVPRLYAFIKSACFLFTDDDRDEEEDDLPKSTWVPPPVIPKEDYKSGANKHVYFVTNTCELFYQYENIKTIQYLIDRTPLL